MVAVEDSGIAAGTRMASVGGGEGAATNAADVGIATVGSTVRMTSSTGSDVE